MVNFQEWIISAAHCFCMKPLQCKSDLSAGTVVDFELRQVKVYLGEAKKLLLLA